MRLPAPTRPSGHQAGRAFSAEPSALAISTAGASARRCPPSTGHRTAAQRELGRRDPVYEHLSFDRQFTTASSRWRVLRRRGSVASSRWQGHRNESTRRVLGGESSVTRFGVDVRQQARGAAKGATSRQWFERGRAHGVRHDAGLPNASSAPTLQTQRLSQPRQVLPFISKRIAKLCY